MSELSVPKVYQAIVNVMSDIDPVAKNKKNPTQGFHYRGIDDVMNALQSSLAKNKLVILSKIIEKNTDISVNKNGNNVYRITTMVEFTFISAEDGSQATAVHCGEGIDTSDKASAKASSSAFKDAMLKSFVIPTEDNNDPDKETPEMPSGAKKAPPTNTLSEKKQNEPEPNIAQSKANGDSNPPNAAPNWPKDYVLPKGQFAGKKLKDIDVLSLEVYYGELVASTRGKFLKADEQQMMNQMREFLFGGKIT